MGRRPEGAPRDTAPGGLTAPTRGGIDVLDSLLVRQPIRAGETGAVRELLAEWATEHADGDVRTLLPTEGVTLTTLFLDRGGFGRSGTRSGDALLWYVEVVDDDAAPWTDPVEAVRSSPLFEAGLDDHLDGSATVHASHQPGHRYVTHATNPNRRALYAERVGRTLVAPVTGAEVPMLFGVTTLELRPGWRGRLVGGAIGVVDRLKRWLTRIDRVDRWLREQTDVLEAEGVYAESLLFDGTAEPPVLYYYVAGEGMDRLYEAYEESNDWTVRFSDGVLRQFMTDPDAFLTPPLESECEPLLHAVAPDRP